MKVAGIGCRADAPPAALRDALARAEAQAGPVAALATIAARRENVAALGLPVHVVAVGDIATPTRSARIHALHRTGSVAEAAALAACGPGARIVVARVLSRCGRATAAIAESETRE
ncbi:cobalamin biosynthesis protein [Paracoccus stylophorae]|uniref:Cobalamin biosynthesis protein n=1 Tax=Paracoccus stylophorae TaxID=659350 RepID=A0ABY7SVV4_9RHOB|nr:cobalamin biosynthesis protein [Paracoccus stylophorae]WCR11159.1 cobalamin biosynthesis protein [Paracoccus stylophorae]